MACTSWILFWTFSRLPTCITIAIISMDRFLWESSCSPTSLRFLSCDMTWRKIGSLQLRIHFTTGRPTILISYILQCQQYICFILAGMWFCIWKILVLLWFKTKPYQLKQMSSRNFHIKWHLPNVPLNPPSNYVCHWQSIENLELAKITIQELSNCLVLQPHWSVFA